MTGEALYYYPYELFPRSALNARSSGEGRRGVLLRSAGGGVACLQPWPELGDHTLKEELEALGRGSPLRLGRQALRCLRADEEAREKGESLFKGRSAAPDSYASLPDKLSREELVAFDEAGFCEGKIKGNRNIRELARELAGYSSLLPDWKWRIDFNGVLTPEEFQAAALRLQEAARNRITFFEDPVPFEEDLWRLWEQAGFSLLPDRISREAVLSRPLKIRVWKPAFECWEEVPSVQAVVTSYMDHPIGQVWAASEAARLADEGVETGLCGLVTQHLYEKNAFSEFMGGVSPEFFVPAGTGVGFDPLLEKLPWKKLSQY